MTFRSLALVAALAVLAGCAGARQSTLLPAAPDATRPLTRDAAGTLVVRVKVLQPQAMPHFVSASTKGMTVDIAGPTNVKKTVGLKVTAKGCKSSLMSIGCTLVVPGLASCPSKKPCYTATVKTYDAYAKGKIPHGSHELSADTLSFRIDGGSTTIPLVLQGIPVRILFMPDAASTLSGSQSSGFVEPKCSPIVESMNLVSLDADGNIIVGPGAPAMTLASSNPTQFAVGRKGANLFALAPPAAPNYAFGNNTITLTAKAMPSKASGAHSVTQTAHIAYSGNICGILTEFPVPSSSSEPLVIAKGPDGALWFTEQAPSANNIGRITITGTFKEFHVPTAASNPAGIVAGPDGNLWFTEFNGNKIGRITTGGAINEYSVPTASSTPEHMIVGPDRNIWFTEVHGSRIARVDTTGAINEFATPTSSSGPRVITVGPDGNLWFTECQAGKIAYSNTGGSITELPASFSNPTGITSGMGRLWVTTYAGNQVVGATTGGVITQQFTVPSATSAPSIILLGPDGAFWVTEQFTGRIARVTVDGTFTETPVGDTGAYPFGLTIGPDGALWFTEAGANKIGRLR